VYCGAEPIRHETIRSVLEAADDLGLDPRALVFSYGLAESTLLVTARRFGSFDDSFAEGAKGNLVANVGQARGGMAVRLDASGGVHVRGKGVFRGYLNQESALPDGWHDTGDVGFIRDGDLFITGRRREMLVVGGENVFPSDIEALVARHPGVAEPLVMTEDDRFYVYVVPNGTVAIDTRALAAEIGSACAAFPAEIAIGHAAAVVRTTSGKPIRTATLRGLRERGLCK
jgi:acyl-CoA synthetase (AMP-forming)/AMP-acid ligase II